MGRTRKRSGRGWGGKQGELGATGAGARGLALGRLGAGAHPTSKIRIRHPASDIQSWWNTSVSGLHTGELSGFVSMMSAM